jgi:hypothetical protein
VLGVTIYRLFTQAYPYGEVEPFSRPHFGRPAPLAAKRPDLPSWLDPIVARACAVAPAERFESVLAFLFELEHGAERAGPERPPRLPLYHRHPLLFWKLVSLILFVACAMVLFARTVHR